MERPNLLRIDKSFDTASTPKIRAMVELLAQAPPSMLTETIALLGDEATQEVEGLDGATKLVCKYLNDDIRDVAAWSQRMRWITSVRDLSLVSCEGCPALLVKTVLQKEGQPGTIAYFAVLQWMRPQRYRFVRPD